MFYSLNIKTIVASIALLTNVTAEDFNKFHKLSFEKEFEPILKSVPLLLNAGGAKIIQRPDGSIWIVSIGVTVTKYPETPKELMRRNIVAQDKARANAIAELNGNKVTVTILYKSTDKVIIENGHEKAQSEEVLEEKIVTEARGIIREIAKIANWMDEKETLYYVAIAKRIR